MLESVGVSADHIVIGHTCCLDDPSASVLIRIAERGAIVGVDESVIQAVQRDTPRRFLAFVPL